MAAKKTAAKAVDKGEPETIQPIPTAASREADKQEASPVFRVDLGEALPTPLIRTATDNDKSSKK